MSATRFRARPALPELPKGAERSIIEQFRQIQAVLDQLQGPQRSASPALNAASYAAKPGELVLVEGIAGGTLVMLPQGSPANIEQKIRVVLVGGVLSPGVTIAIAGSGTIDGSPTATMTARGLIELTSVGERGWSKVSAASGGSTLPPDGTYGEITVSGAGTLWTVNAGAVLVSELGPIADETFVGNVSGAPAAPSAINLSSLAGTNLTWNSALNRLDASGGGGSLTLLSTEINLGSRPTYSGTFTIAGVGMTPGKAVLIQQAAGPYTGKGTLADEAEDQVTASASVTSATVITAFWRAVWTPLVGNVKFNYAVSA